MNIIREYVEYHEGNSQDYWFKRKLYGWGWKPVKWQGWLVVAISLAIFFGGVYIGEINDAPGAASLGFIIMLSLLFFFGYTKGEKPRWQWGERK